MIGTRLTHYEITAHLGPSGTATDSRGFLTGMEYIKGMGETQRMGYVQGLVNGLSVSPMIGAPASTTSRLQKCLVGMTPRQIDPILSKYLNEHPERWHNGLNVLSLDAILEAWREK